MSNKEKEQKQREQKKKKGTKNSKGRQEKEYKTIKVRIKTEQLTRRKKRRMEQIAGRDTRIIKEYMKLLKNYEWQLTVKRGKKKVVNKSKLDQWTLTTSKNIKSGKRTKVRFDFKRKFKRCSHDEFQECRDKAVELFNSWLELKRIAKLKHLPYPSFPNLKGKIARRQLFNKDRVKLAFSSPNTVARAWLGLRDSLDSKLRGSKTKRHKRLWLPLALSPYHERELKNNKIKSVELIYAPSERQWWAMLTVEYTALLSRRSALEALSFSLPPAVLGIDLGERNTAVLSLLSPSGSISRHDIKFIKNKEGKNKLKKIESVIGSLHRKFSILRRDHKDFRSVLHALQVQYRRYRSYARSFLYHQLDPLISFITPLLLRYRLYVAIGYPKYLKADLHRPSRSPPLSPTLSHRLHYWYYRTLLLVLRRRLLSLGLAPHHVLALDERQTSVLCSRCHHLGLRPVQSSFICPHCGYRLHADLNGSKNISFLLILTVLSGRPVFDLLTSISYPPSFFPSFLALGQWL